MHSKAAPIPVRFVLSHPVQYFSPLFRELARRPEIQFEVWYCSEEGLKDNHDVGFGTTLTWDIPLLDGYTSRFFPNKARRPSIHYGFMGLWNPDLLATLRKSSDKSVIILHGWGYISHLMILLNSRLYGHPLILRGDNPDHHDRILSPFKKFLKQCVLRPLLLIPNRVLYAGKRNFSFFRMYGVPESKLDFAPHSVDNARFRLSESVRAEKRSWLRKQFNIPEEAIVVISPAKYIFKKRLRDAIEGVAGLNNPNVYLVLAGEGPSREFLKQYGDQLLPGRVRLTGFINQSEMPDFYAMSDILCLCSGIGETWGLAVNEGMNAGLPLVLSDLCGCAEDLVIPGENGFIYPCGDIPALTRQLAQLTDNAELRMKLGRKSMEMVERYSIEATAEGIIQSVLQTRRPS